MFPRALPVRLGLAAALSAGCTVALDSRLIPATSGATPAPAPTRTPLDIDLSRGTGGGLGREDGWPISPRPATPTTPTPRPTSAPSAGPTPPGAPTPSASPSPSPSPSPIIPDPACTRDGCLRSYGYQGGYPLAALKIYLQPGVAIDNGYDIYTMRYATLGREAGATVAIPSGIAAPAAGWHLVVNNHPTFGLDDPCALEGTLPGIGLAALFGARGMIGVAPDHPGLGTPGIQPYLVSRSEGASALDAIRAARSLAAILGRELSGRNAIVGLSQGGHATLAAAAMHAQYAPELAIRAFGATAPATVWETHWASGVAPGDARIGYLAMAFYAWSKHYGKSTPSLWSPTLSSDIDETMTSLCLVAQSGPSLTTTLPTTPEDVFDATFLAELKTGTWSAYRHIHEAFEANALKPYTQTAPLRIYQGDADTTVPETQMREVVAALRAGGVTVDYQVVPGGTHTDVAFGFLPFAELRTMESIAWIKEKLAD